MDVPEWVSKLRSGELLTVDDCADIIESAVDRLGLHFEQVESEAHMGAFDEIPNITVPDPDRPASKEYREKHGEGATEVDEYHKKWKWDAGEQVIMRGSYSAADQEIVENASAAIKRDGKKRDIDVRTGTMRRTLLERMIVDWTLTHRGKPVAVTHEAIGKLPPNYRTPLLERIDEITEGMSEEEQEDFLPSSNGHMKANLPTTK